MLKRWIVNVTIVIVVCLLSIELFSFAATEANLLLFNNIPQIYQSRYSGTAWRTHKELWGSWHKPNATDRHKEQCFDVTYRSNEIGARDGRFNPTKLSSKVRYLLIGDSFAEGYGVDFEETAQAQLEKLLPIDVYNFGSDGYFGPVQYYQMYNHLAGTFQHDGVILFFLPANDFTDNDYSLWKHFHPSWYRPYYHKKDGDQYDIFYPSGAIPTENYDDQIEHPIIRFLYRYTFTLNTLRTIKYLVARGPLEKLGYSGFFDATLDQQRAAVYFLEKILRDAASKGVDVFILVIPNAADMARIRSGHSYRDQYWFKELEAMKTRNANLKIINMADQMPLDYAKLFLSCDNHWNAAGNLAAANMLAAQIRASLTVKIDQVP